MRHPLPARTARLESTAAFHPKHPKHLASIAMLDRIPTSPDQQHARFALLASTLLSNPLPAQIVRSGSTTKMNLKHRALAAELAATQQI